MHGRTRNSARGGEEDEEKTAAAARAEQRRVVMGVGGVGEGHGDGYGRSLR